MISALVTLDDYESEARGLVGPAAWEYIHSGAADELTLKWNRQAFARLALNPRVLRDVHAIDTGLTLLGQPMEHPIMLAPVAAHSLVHPDGEVATADAARETKTGMVLSSYTSRPIEEVARVGVSPLWFQLYMQERAATRALVARLKDTGFQALCLTVDTPTSGARDRQARAGFEFPELPYRTVEPGDNPCTWSDIEWISETARMPVVLKGILHPDDAELAIDAGAAAIVVSNHGGRNLDTLPATIDVLPRIVERVRARVPVLMDGGIRRGTDVLKALALGAAAVLIGRPYIYGLAVGGAAGAAAVVEILRRELTQAMALTGHARLGTIDRSTIWAPG
jgi:4-hydroxymandelate oxidase